MWRICGKFYHTWKFPRITTPLPHVEILVHYKHIKFLENKIMAFKLAEVFPEELKINRPDKYAEEIELELEMKGLMHRVMTAMIVFYQEQE